METNTKKKKLTTTGLAIALAALLLIGGGTFAYLQSSTGNVVNAFNTNQVKVDLKETTGNSYDIVPGTTQDKNPTVTVTNTVDAYVYVTVTDNTDGLVEYAIADGWMELKGVENVYYREVKKSDSEQKFEVLKGNTVTYSAALENSNMLNEDGSLKDGITLSFNASATQKDPFDNPVKAYFQTEKDIVKLENATAEGLTAEIDKAEGRTAILLQSDIETDSSIEIPEGKDIALSLAEGAQITSTKASTPAIKNNGKLTLIGGTVDAQGHAAAAVYNEVGATAVLENVTLTRSQEAGVDSTNNGGNSYYAVLNHGNMTLRNCDVSANGKYSSLIENGWQDGTKNTTKEISKLTISGGTYTGGLNTIKNDDYGELVVNGGVFKNDAQYALMNYNVATINGGTFTSSVNSVVYNNRLDDTMDKGDLTITGGTFNYPSQYYGIYDVGQNGSLTIKGGTFATQYITNHLNVCTATKNSAGTYTVSGN